MTSEQTDDQLRGLSASAERWGISRSTLHILLTRGEVGYLRLPRLFHANWRAVDLVRCTPRGLYSVHERDPRSKTLRALIETVID